MTKTHLLSGSLHGLEGALKQVNQHLLVVLQLGQGFGGALLILVNCPWCNCR